MTIHLLEARHFPVIAARNGITQSARTLTFEGRLIPVEVGRRTYYRWRDILPLMPDQARRRHAAVEVEPVVTGRHLPGLSGRTVTVEQATRLVALRLGVAYGEPVAVERLDGALVAAVAVPRRTTPQRFARMRAVAAAAEYVEVAR